MLNKINQIYAAANLNVEYNNRISTSTTITNDSEGRILVVTTSKGVTSDGDMVSTNNSIFACLYPCFELN